MFPATATGFPKRGQTIRSKVGGLSFHEKSNSRFNGVQHDSGSQTDNKKGGDQQHDRPSATGWYVSYSLPSRLGFSHENRPICPKHINSRDHYAPKGDRTHNLKFI